MAKHKCPICEISSRGLSGLLGHFHSCHTGEWNWNYCFACRKWIMWQRNGRRSAGFNYMAFMARHYGQHGKGSFQSAVALYCLSGDTYPVEIRK